MTTIASAGKATSAAVHEGLVGHKRDVSGTVFLVLLLGSLLFSLAILFILLADVMSKGLPVFAERGTDFLTSPLSSNPATAGVAQGIIGTAILGVIVAVTAFPVRPRDRDLPRGVRRRGPADPVHPDQHPQPRRRAVRGVRPARAVGVRRRVPVDRSRHGPEHPRRRRDARGARPPDRHHHVHRGAAGGAHGDPRGRLRRRRLALGGHPPARPARGGPRRADGHGARPVAGARRDGAR